MSRATSTHDPRAGGQAHKVLLGQLCEALCLRGYHVLWVWNSLHSPPGKYDITALKPPRWLEIECKCGEATLSRAQRRYGELMTRYPWVESRVVRDTRADWDSFVAWIA